MIGSRRWVCSGLTKKGIPIQANCMDQVLAHLVFINYIITHVKTCIKTILDIKICK
jgi:hypothetical protein